MNSKDYYLSMKKKLSGNYDVYDDFLLNNTQTDLYAHFYARNERYFATKSATLYAYESNEHTFFKHHERVNTADITDFVNVLKESIDSLVDPHDEHMSTRLNAVIVTDAQPSREVIQMVQSFKFQKTFFFGLKGWVDICVILVNLENGQVTTSKKAKKMAPHFSPLPLQ